jgi:hypothetical protein
MGGIIHAYYDCGTSPLMSKAIYTGVYVRVLMRYSIAILVLRIYAFGKSA